MSASDESPAPERHGLAAERGAWLRIREPIPGWMAWALGALPIALLLLVWFTVTSGRIPEERLISPTILPSPVEVARSLPSLWFERALTRNLAVSFSRVLAGFVAALVVALPLGILMGSFSKVKAALLPSLEDPMPGGEPGEGVPAGTAHPGEAQQALNRCQEKEAEERPADSQGQLLSRGRPCRLGSGRRPLLSRRWRGQALFFPSSCRHSSGGASFVSRQRAADASSS